MIFSASAAVVAVREQRLRSLMSTFMKSVATRSALEFPMTDGEQKARVQLAACYRIFDHFGWTELIFNHISLRVPGPEPVFLINPFGMHYSEIKASDLVLINLNGEIVRPSEWPINRAGFIIHSAIHGAIAHAHCVMHTHTTTGTAVACLRGGLSPHNFYAAALQGQVAYHAFEGRTVDIGERNRMVDSLGSKRLLILRNHGLLAWGSSLSEAFLSLFTLQRACDVQIAAAAAGEINPIDPEVLADYTRQSTDEDQRQKSDVVFAALQRIIDRKNPSYRE
jgi:ribulose-5-phosphate 4-epimerase/fuculose-1-phosphate aldolase